MRVRTSLLLIAAMLAAAFAGRSGANEPEPPSLPESELQGVVRTGLDSPEPTRAQLARKQRSVAFLQRLGLPNSAVLPVVKDEADVEPRSSQEVAKRCLATVFCSVKGETQDQQLVDELVEKFEAASFFSPMEKEFIRSKAPNRQELIDYTWRYECVHVFMWALNYNQELKPPNTICDVAADVSHIRETGPERFVSSARIRPMNEILDMADLYYHLHWAAIELRIHGKKSESLDEGIIRERHRALNWLIRYMDQEWDEVSTDT